MKKVVLSFVNKKGISSGITLHMRVNRYGFIAVNPLFVVNTDPSWIPKPVAQMMVLEQAETACKA